MGIAGYMNDTELLLLQSGQLTEGNVQQNIDR